MPANIANRHGSIPNNTLATAAISASTASMPSTSQHENVSSSSAALTAPGDLASPEVYFINKFDDYMKILKKILTNIEVNFIQ